MFINVGGTASPYELGDHASVTLTCQFTLITPLAGAILGGGITLEAEAVMPVRSGSIAGIPGPQATPTPVPSPTPTPGPTPTPAPTPACSNPPIAAFSANPTQGQSPLHVQFQDISSSGGPLCIVTGWLWNFGDGTTSTLQNPSHNYTTNRNRENFRVTLTVTNSVGSDSEVQNNYITVTN